MTLNLAHGRGAGRHQLLQSTESITANLQQVSTLLSHHQCHLVAMQEVDRVSAWNGRFDHFEHIATSTGYEHCIHADNVNNFGLTYGAGLLSHLPLSNGLAVTFEPAPPLPQKGFVVATIEWQSRLLDIVSVHLDPASNNRRAQQAEQLCAVLKSRKIPKVVMGDFNCGFNRSKVNALKLLRDDLQLQGWKTYATGMATFPRLKRRFDWILISEELRFIRYKTIKENVSDHLPVLAEVAWHDLA